MESRAEAILSTLFGVSLRYGKKYCYPSQGKIEQLLFDYHGIDISNRTLNRDLLDLVNLGYLKRVRRTRRGPGVENRFTSTLYKFRAKAYIWLNSLAKWSKKILSSCRLPKMADNKSMKGNEIFERSLPSCGIPVESSIEGGASRVTRPSAPAGRRD
jgi:DNA-binding HxlR family transcriptional regulator